MLTDATDDENDEKNGKTGKFFLNEKDSCSIHYLYCTW